MPRQSKTPKKSAKNFLSTSELLNNGKRTTIKREKEEPLLKVENPPFDKSRKKQCLYQMRQKPELIIPSPRNESNASFPPKKEPSPPRESGEETFQARTSSPSITSSLYPEPPGESAERGTLPPPVSTLLHARPGGSGEAERGFSMQARGEEDGTPLHRGEAKVEMMKTEVIDAPCDESCTLAMASEPPPPDVFNPYMCSSSFEAPVGHSGEGTPKEHGVLDISSSNIEPLSELFPAEPPGHPAEGHHLQEMALGQDCSQLAPLTIVPPARLPSIESAFSRLGEGFQTPNLNQK